MTRMFAGTLAALLLAPTGLDAQTPDGTGDRAFLFAYTARDGDQRSLFEGYREHLDWHVEKEDPLRWLAWTVASGPRVGLFVDGTFGNAPGALDERVDPAGDARDAARTFLPHAIPAWRTGLRLRPDLGRSRRLESGQPTPLMLVATLEGEPGRMEALESGLRSVLGGDGTSPYGGPAAEAAVYETMGGGASPTYLLVVPMERQAELGPAHDLLRAVLSEEAAGPGVRSVRSEVWRYRGDLSYEPGDGS